MAAADAAILTVGLTGGAASGKSTMAAALRALGAPVLDADAVARDVVAPGSTALARIAEAFGAGFLTPAGELDRARMRRHVFSQPDARRALEAITHPAIRARLAAWRDAQTGPYCVLEVSILLESGMVELVDRVLVVDAPEATQVERLTRRDRVDEALARDMLAAQASRQQRLARADDVFTNAGPVAALQEAAARLHAFYVELARTGRRRAAGLHLP